MPVSLSLSPIRTLDGRMIGVSKIARDMTLRKKAEERLAALLAELERDFKLMGCRSSSELSRGNLRFR